MLRHAFCALILVLGSLPPAEVAGAQAASDNTVSGSNIVTLRPKPTKFRVQVELRSYGKTAAIALENLKARREAAITALKELKADPGSIVCSPPKAIPASITPALAIPTSPPSVSSSGSYSSPSSGEWTPAPSSIAPTPVPSSSEPAPRKDIHLYMASATLRADWPLNDADLDQIAAAGAAIREKVSGTDIEGANAEQDLSPEEQELIEEAQMRITQNAQGFQFEPPTTVSTLFPGQKSAVPLYAFVATLSAAERKEGIAKAFDLAKHDAADLAAAAEMKLGPIAEIAPILMLERLINAKRENFMYVNGEPSPLVGKSDDEDVASNADGLEFVVGVSVRFHLIPGSK